MEAILRHRAAGRAFTLVEMLVVVGILTVLAAILLPVLWQARNRARDRTCSSNLAQLGKATLMYAQDYDGVLPEAPAGPRAGSLFAYLQAQPNDRVSVYINGLSLDVRQSLMPSGSTYTRCLLAIDRRIPSDGVFACPNDVGAPEFGFRKGTVYDAALCSYLWDPQGAGQTGEDADQVVGVNGREQDSLSDPSAEKLWQDYGAAWHQVRRRALTGDSWQTIGRVNAVFADGHTAAVDMAAITRQDSSGTLLSVSRVR